MEKIDIINLWAEADFATGQWRDWAWERVVPISHLLTAESASHRPVSALLLQPYRMNWIGGEECDMGYIMCAATAKAHRHEGLMRLLIRDALFKAREVGMAMVTLIPASRELFFFYDKLGFATAIYEDRRRYVPDAVFTLKGSNLAIETIGKALNESDIRAIRDVERGIPGHVIHTPSQINNFLEDNRMDHGYAAIARNARGELRGICLAVPTAEIVNIGAIIASGVDAERALLHDVAGRFKDLPMVAHCMVSDDRPLEARGMARIADVDKVMRLIAGSVNDKKPRFIRVRDSLIPANNHTWILSGGDAEINDKPRSRYDLDVSVNVLTRILCGGGGVGDVFELPTCRPFLALMLE